MKRQLDETKKEFEERKAVKRLRKAPKEPTDKRTTKAERRALSQAEKDYSNEAMLDRQDARDKKRKAADRWDFQVDVGGRITANKGETVDGPKLAALVATAEGTGLDLNCLRLANIARSESKKGFNHPLDAWSIAEWTNAMQGEAGEAGNIAKKLIRIRYSTRGNKKGDGGHAKLLKALAQEIADTVVYADLCLASEGISLSDAVRDAFNRKSKEIGFKFKL